MTIPVHPPQAAKALERFVELARAALGDEVHSILVVGSLAHGDFVDAFSDIDAITVLASDNVSAVRPAMKGVRERLAAELGEWGRKVSTDYCVPLQRLDRIDLDDENAMLPKDIVDVKRHGLVIFGRDPRPALREPTPDEVREGVVYMHYWLGLDRKDLSRFGPKELINCVFNTAQAHLTVETGSYEFVKTRAAGAHAGLFPDWRVLVLGSAGSRRRWAEEPWKHKAWLDALRARLPLFAQSLTAAIEQRGLNRFRCLRTKTPGIVWDGSS